MLQRKRASTKVRFNPFLEVEPSTFTYSQLCFGVLVFYHCFAGSAIKCLSIVYSSDDFRSAAGLLLEFIFREKSCRGGITLRKNFGLSFVRITLQIQTCQIVVEGMARDAGQLPKV